MQRFGVEAGCNLRGMSDIYLSGNNDNNPIKQKKLTFDCLIGFITFETSF